MKVYNYVYVFRFIDDESEERNDGNIIVQDMASASVRLRGQVERDRLMDAMPA